MLDFLVAGIAGGIGALLFLEAGMFGLQAASSLMSSPWTAESFGADERRSRSAKEYLAHAVVISTAAGIFAALIAASWWPVIGIAAINVYLVWVYMRAISRGREAGSTSWANDPASNVVRFTR